MKRPGGASDRTTRRTGFLGLALVALLCVNPALCRQGGAVAGPAVAGGLRGGSQEESLFGQWRRADALRSEIGTMGDDGRTGAALEIERVDVQLRVEDLVEREVVCGTVRAKQASAPALARSCAWSPLHRQVPVGLLAG